MEDTKVEASAPSSSAAYPSALAPGRNHLESFFDPPPPPRGARNLAICQVLFGVMLAEALYIGFHVTPGVFLFTLMVGLPVLLLLSTRKPILWLGALIEAGAFLVVLLVLTLVQQVSPAYQALSRDVYDAFSVLLIVCYVPTIGFFLLMVSPSVRKEFPPLSLEQPPAG